MQELKAEDLIPLGHDFAQGKYRGYFYQKERYQRIKQQVAESRGDKCPWCGKRQIHGYSVDVTGYHTECFNQKMQVKE